MNTTVAALLGSVATAIAIFAGGLAVEAYKRHRDRMGMALALAGAIDALLSLIDVRDMTAEIQGALPALEAGTRVEFASLIRDNSPYEAITLAYANQIGDLGGDLPFRVARFLTHSQGLQHDIQRLGEEKDQPQTQALVIRKMSRLWEETRELGEGLVRDLRAEAGARTSRRSG